MPHKWLQQTARANNVCTAYSGTPSICTMLRLGGFVGPFVAFWTFLLNPTQRRTRLNQWAARGWAGRALIPLEAAYATATTGLRSGPGLHRLFDEPALRHAVLGDRGRWQVPHHAVAGTHDEGRVEAVQAEVATRVVAAALGAEVIRVK